MSTNLKLSLNELKELQAFVVEQMLLAKKEEKVIRGGKKRDPNEKIKCDICDGQYTIHNKPAHNKTKKHMKAQQSFEVLQNMARGKTIARRVAPPTISKPAKKKVVVNKEMFKKTKTTGSKTSKKQPVKKQPIKKQVVKKQPAKKRVTIQRGGKDVIHEEIIDIDDEMDLDNFDDNDIINEVPKENVRNILDNIHGHFEKAGLSNETTTEQFGGIFTEQDEQPRYPGNRNPGNIY